MRSKHRQHLVIPNGFEANFTLGFAKGLKTTGVDFLALSCDETENRLNAAGVANCNIRGSLDESRSFFAKVRNLLCYYAVLLITLVKHRGRTIHFIGIFQNKRVLFEGLFFSLCFRLAASRYIYTVHNVLPHSRTNSKLFKHIYQWVYRFPNVLVVHTKLAREQLITDFSVPSNKIRLSSIGLNEEMPSSSIDFNDSRRRLGIRPDEKVILFFGKIDHYKGLDVLLSAYEMLPKAHFRLLIAGEFRDASCRKQILKQMEINRYREEIIFQEKFVPNEEVEVYFKAADVLCLPYRSITQSGLVFLAPRFGLPMVTSDVGSLREFVEGGLGLIASSNDANGLAKALLLFFDRQEEFQRQKIVKQAKKYSWKNICADLAPIYSTGGNKPSLSSVRLN